MTVSPKEEAHTSFAVTADIQKDFRAENKINFYILLTLLK
jgi:hypothetical protein